MATPSASKVFVGRPKVGGAIFRAPIGTALPTSELTALDPAFIQQGHVDADGFKRAITKAFNSIKAWGGEEVAKPRTELSVSAAFNLIQTLDPDVNKTVFGSDAVAVTEPTPTAGTKIAVAFDGADLPPSAWVVDLAQGTRIRRIVFGNAEIATEAFEQVFKDDELEMYPVELAIYRDASDVFFYDYSDDGVKTA